MAHRGAHHAADHARLQSELVSRGINFSGNGGGFRIPYSDATPQALINHIETPLSLLKVHEPSLEEAYVNLLEGTAS